MTHTHDFRQPLTVNLAVVVAIRAIAIAAKAAP